MQMVRESALAPLILAASTESVEVQRCQRARLTAPGGAFFVALDSSIVRREVAATLCNLALSEENKVTMARSGVIPALIALAQVAGRSAA
jgi:hypothetical protein